MDNLRTAAHEPSQNVEGSRHGDDGEEDEQVGVGEEVDEGGDGVVGRDACEQLALVYPSERLLVACHLHPDGVDGVGRDGDDVGDDDDVLAVELEGVDGHVDECLGGQLADDGQRVGAHLEVVALGVVVCGVEGDAVNLGLAERQGVGCLLAAVVAGGQEDDEEEDGILK